MGWGALGALGGNAITGIIAANSAKKAAEISAKASEENTQKQIDWYREMANNAHQMEVEDLRKAGLNPILSAGGSTAGAIASNGISPQMPDTSGYAQSGKALAEGLQGAFGNIMDLARLKNETKIADSQENVNTAIAEKNIEETKWIEPQARQSIEESGTRMALNKANSAEAASRIDKNEKEMQLVEQQIVMNQIEQGIKEIEAEINKSPFGKTMAYIDKLAQTIGNIGAAGQQYVNAISTLKNAKNKEELSQNLKNLKNGFRRIK